jgi:ABC-type multidrug transport system fused ATPase/permease subunit
MRHVLPYRRIIGISFVCAIFVGVATSGGLTAMIPIMRVLLDGQTVADWANSQIVEKRLGIGLAEDRDVVRLVQVKRDHPAAAAGLRSGEQIRAPGTSSGPAGSAATLALLADPSHQRVRISREAGPDIDLVLPPVPFYQVAELAVTNRVSTHPVWAVAEVFGFLALLSIFGNVLKFFQEYLSDKAATLAVNDIRRRLYDHVLHVPLSRFGSHGTSDVTSRLVQDSSALEQGFKTVLGQSIQQPITALMAFCVAMLISWRLTLIIVVFGPFMGAIVQKFGKKMRRASRSALQKSSTMLGHIEGTMSGIRVVKGASAERFERRRYREIMEKLVGEQLKMSRIDALSSPILESLTLLMIGSIVLISTYMVCVSQSLKKEQFFIVMACLATIADSLRRLHKVNNVLQKSNAAATRIFETMDLPVETVRVGNRAQGRSGLADDGHRSAEHPEQSSEPASTINGNHIDIAPHRRVKLPILERDIRFENITFTYPNASGPALIDASLSVPRGQSVAIVGRNGSGKTTLLALLPRFYDPQQGRVLIDGIDIRNATLRSLRGQISIVTQDSVIFPGTIAQNIAYANPRATREQIIAAARRAFAHDFILTKPLGYDTVLGEMGGLSGGEKQRVCIARAILRNAPILILDEATSQVDAASEHLIQQAIDGLIHERCPSHQSAGGNVESPGGADGLSAGPTAPTTFVIAHRFSTIQSADTIVVMDRGRIAGQGRHDELLATCQTYQQLYERQLFAMPAA